MAKEVTIITGGQRSGKSSFAQSQALALSDSPVYLATARVLDQDFRARVQRHKKDRDARWTTIEEHVHIGQVQVQGKVVVLDCATLWLTNIFLDKEGNVEESLALAKEEWGKLLEKDIYLIAVTNEIGMGVHAENEMARKFVDLQGWMNQFMAQQADKLYLMACGVPLLVKPGA